MDRIRIHDPFFYGIPRFVTASPRRAALAFAVLSTLTSCLASGIEGTFFSAKTNSAGIKIWPFYSNVSTVVDFLLLDPLLIYFTIRCYNAISKIELDDSVTITVPSWSAFIATAALALMTMIFYVFSFLETLPAPWDQARSFLKESFGIPATRSRPSLLVYDAIISGPTIHSITYTGLVVFFWTLIVVYILYLGVYVQLQYVTRVSNLTSVNYQPFHPDDSGGLGLLAEPAWEFLRVMLVLFVIFAVFYYQDLLVYMTDKSFRLEMGSILYFCLAFPVFLIPVVKLHRLMKECRNSYEFFLNEKLIEITNKLTTNSSASIDTDEFAKEIEAMTKVRAQIRTFTTWPLPVRGTFESVAYLIGPILPILLKLW